MEAVEHGGVKAAFEGVASDHLSLLSLDSEDLLYYGVELFH